MNLRVFSSGILLVTLAIYCSAQHTVNRTVFIQSLEWSTDSKTICFSALVLDSGKFVNGKWEIYSVNIDGSNLKKLTSNIFDDDWPSISPDKKKVVFASNRDGNTEIYQMDIDGNNQARITHNDANDSEPVWSPDGKKILFVSNRDGSYQLYTINPDGSEQMRLTTTGYDLLNPSWSPDGKKITYYSDKGDHKDQVYVTDADGRNTLNVTGDTMNNIFPSWSHDGRRIIYGSGGMLYSITANGSNDKKSLSIAGFFGRFSPDGKQLAFISGRWPDSDIFISDDKGSYQKLIRNKQLILNLN